MHYGSKKEDKDQESIQPSNTPDPGYQWESDNVTIRHNKREPRDNSFCEIISSLLFKGGGSDVVDTRVIQKKNETFFIV